MRQVLTSIHDLKRIMTKRHIHGNHISILSFSKQVEMCYHGDGEIDSFTGCVDLLSHCAPGSKQLVLIAML